MSNFEEKFRNWQERMSKKTEKERHAYAMTVALTLAGVVAFFVISNWYFVLSGNQIRSTFFTDFEAIYFEQKENFSKSREKIINEGKDIINVINTGDPKTDTEIQSQ